MASGKDDIRARLLATFRVEAAEHLQAITTNLLALDRGLPPGETREVIEVTFREMHTLKGAARSVSLREVEALCQACESLLSRITRGQVVLSRPMLQHFREAVDGVARLVAGGGAPSAMRELIERLERAVAEPEPAAAAPGVALAPAADGPSEHAAAGLPQVETIRMATARLDTLLVQAEDFLAPKLTAGERVQEIRALVGRLEQCRTVLGRLRAAQGAVNGQAADPLAALDSDLRAVESEARELLAHLRHDQRTIASVVDSLLDEIRRLRMTPASFVLDLFPRMVWDLARAQGKEVEWVARGADLDVDRKVLEAIKDPLIHLVRNAVDHGIEPPATRAEAGKALKGRVGVIIDALEGNRIEIRVEDDGAGIDMARVKAEAVRTRLLTSEEAESLTDEHALSLIYRSGLSTSPIITDLSGHGLGLAIVKERVERFGGQIHFETRSGVGTTVRMTLPATIATFCGLLVEAGGQAFLLPIEAVERAIRIAPDAIETVEGREAIRSNGSPLAVARLSGLLELPGRDDPHEPGSQHPCVIVRSGEERVALLVEKIVGDREVLVKELRPPLIRVRNVAGAGLLGTGRLVLILRPADLLRAAREGSRPAGAPATPREEERQKAILVVDDSITTRTMEKNLLEAAGYQVRVAVDGIDAWTLLKSEAFDLVVSDVDMPRMNGFDLTARIRTDRKLADLPVILVTALEAREDKERGVEVGANAYIIKSSFDQSNLLEIIRRLV
jgi:two-component system chemotaxis sensor kinase CheA